MDSQYLGTVFGLADRVVLITGGRHGIGAALAVACARAGARVAVTARSAAGLEPVVAAVEAAGGEALPLAMELGDRASIEAAVAAAHRHFGRIDVLVNNAGVAVRAPSLTYPEADWDLVLNTNLRGTFLTCQAVAPHMIAQGGGRIINISSTFARVAQPNRAAYAASKAGVEQLTRSLAVEWAPHGITVNAVAPSLVVTETRQELVADPAALAERIRQIPLGRLATPEDVVAAVLFLAGNGAAFITGHTLVVDGGYTCV